MPTEITSTLDFPDWFNLSNYDVCETLSAKQWGAQLRARKEERVMVRIIAEAHRRPGLASINIESQKTRLKRRIASGCIREPKDQRRLAAERDSTYYSPQKGGMDFHGCVRPALLDDIVSSQRTPENYFLAYDEVFPSHRILLDVDLSATDTALEEKFADVIKKYRQMRSQKNPGKSGTEASLEKLRQYRVLPYIDLYHWAELSGIKIHSEVMARALFPNTYRDGRFVRGTLKDWAEDSLRPGFISTLIAPS